MNAVKGEVGSRPVPDPTLLTTEALQREIRALRELLETRIDGGDKLVALLQDSISRRKAEIGAEVLHLQKLHEEKFASVQNQFAERDKRAEQTSTDSKAAVGTAFLAAKEAVNAALQAAKEAVAEQNKSSSLAISKSETATMKQIDQIGVMITSTNLAMNDKIDDLKARLNTIGGKSEGVGASWAVMLGAVSLISTLVAIGALVYRARDPVAVAAPVPQIVYLPAPASAAVPPAQAK